MINTAAAEELLSRMDKETLGLVYRYFKLQTDAWPGKPEEDSIAAVFISADPAKVDQVATFVAALIREG